MNIIYFDSVGLCNPIISSSDDIIRDCNYRYTINTYLCLFNIDALYNYCKAYKYNILI